MRRSLGFALGLTISVIGPVMAEGSPELGKLTGSHASMERQNEVAKENDYSFVRTSRQVSALVEEGALVPALGNADYRLANVSHPATRPITRTFVERLGKDYHQTCGSPLIVTSLTRPLNEQPRNASDLSVHPAGMAVDLRIPANSFCRTWLESQLLLLERRGVLDVTREKRPAHYHVAVFPDAYKSWVTPFLVADSIAASAGRSASLAQTAIAALAPPKMPNSDSIEKAINASVAPGPGTLGTILYALILLSGVTALLIVIRGPVREPAKIPPGGDRRRN